MLVRLVIEPRASHMLSKCFATELCTQPSFDFPFILCVCAHIRPVAYRFDVFPYHPPLSQSSSFSLGCLVTKPLGSACLCPSTAGVTSIHHCTQLFLCGFWVLNPLWDEGSDLCPCVTSTLLTEPCPSPDLALYWLSYAPSLDLALLIPSPFFFCHR